MKWATALAVVMATLTSAPASAQTYDDGVYVLTCYGTHLITRQIVPVRGVNDGGRGYFAFASHDTTGYPIINYNRARIEKTPRIFWLFTYYHECAHHELNSTDEVLVNCRGLQNMRAAGHISPSDEEVVAQITRDEGPGGAGETYWNQTIACAGPPSPPAAPGNLRILGG